MFALVACAVSSITNPVQTVLAIMSSEQLAGYIVTAFLTIINLLITYWFLKKFLFKPALTFMKKRSDDIASQLENARVRKDEAEAILKEANEKIDNSLREAAVIVDEAKTQAEMQGSSIIEAARREAVEIVGRGRDDVDRMKKASIQDMKDEVADLSVAIAYKIVSSSLDEKKRRELLDQFIGEEFDGRS